MIHKSIVNIFSVIFRVGAEGFVLWRLYYETGIWTLVFALLVTLYIELINLQRYLLRKSDEKKDDSCPQSE